MSLVDPVAEFVRIKRAYMNKRGAVYSTGLPGPSGQALMPPSQMVPKTTWGDVTNFGIKFLAWTSNDEIHRCTSKEMKELGYDPRMTLDELVASPFLTALERPVVAGMIETQCSKPYVETSSFKRAREAFLNAMPVARLYAESPTEGVSATLAGKIASNEVYPYNEAFWGYGSRYAIARSAAGMVPTNAAMFLQSVNEAIDELPTTIKNALKAVVPDVPMPDIPGFGIFGALIKWTIVGGGIYLLWKYWKK